jgi:hypothetical protein
MNLKPLLSSSWIGSIELARRKTAESRSACSLPILDGFGGIKLNTPTRSRFNRSIFSGNRLIGYFRGICNPSRLCPSIISLSDTIKPDEENDPIIRETKFILPTVPTIGHLRPLIWDQGQCNIKSSSSKICRSHKQKTIVTSHQSDFADQVKLSNLVLMYILNNTYKDRMAVLIVVVFDSRPIWVCNGWRKK